MGPQDKVAIFSYAFEKKGKEVCLGTVSFEIVCPALRTFLFVICMLVFSLILWPIGVDIFGFYLHSSTCMFGPDV